jgi:hypothetical protein
MTLQACNLTSDLLHKPCACSSNQDSRSCNCTIRAAKQSGIYVHACSRVLMRSDIPWSCTCHKTVQPETTQPGDGSKQVQLYSPSCTTIWHRCVCLFRWVGPIKQMLQAVPGCDGMLHKPCAYGIQNSLQTAAADH